MRIPTRPLVTGGALAAAVLLAACGGGHDRDTAANGPDDAEVLLQPVSDPGPDPFTASTATSGGTPAPVTRTPQPPATGDEGPRSYSGATPGLYAGTRNTGSCDVERQVAALAADPARNLAFAQSSGIAPESVPDYLRGLTSVLLRADTRVTDHGFRDGQATAFPSVLQAGTAVLVDDRGVPRVRCACGNPLGRPTGTDADPATRGRPWSGYRAAGVVVVTPAPVVITGLTILDVTADTWIERPAGRDGPRHDHPVPRPGEPTPTGRPDTSPSPRDTPPGPHDSAPEPRGSATGRAPRDESEETVSPDEGRKTPSPDGSADDCAGPRATRTAPPETGEATPEESADPGTGPAVTPSDDSVMGVSRHDRPDRHDEPAGCPTVTRGPAEPAEPSTEPGAPTEDTGPGLPDLPGDGGLVPDDPDPGESVFDVSTGVFAG